MAAVITPSASLPSSRTSTPPPQSKPVPTSFTSSLSAWWNNSSYKEARIAEERLLRRLKVYQPPEQPVPAAGWFGFGGASQSGSTAIHHTSESKTPGTKEDVIEPINMETGGLVATLRNVFIQTPNPDLAPENPSDLYIPPSDSTNSSSSSLDSQKHKKHGHHKLGHKRHENDKLVDYVNTLEISKPQDKDSNEAVVVVHGYAAAMGYVFLFHECI